MTLDSGVSQVCTSAEYASPDVPVTALPSAAYDAAFADITPDTDEGWRVGAPVRAVVEGAARAASDVRARLPAINYAIALLTDGNASGCGQEYDSIDSIAQAVLNAPVHVLTIADPTTNAPRPNDMPSSTATIDAGGALRTHAIDVGDPEQTAADIRSALDRIASEVDTCRVDIPPSPDGSALDPARLHVQLSVDAERRALVYDPSCTHPFAWSYDDEEHPSFITLCPETCDSVRQTQALEEASLELVFGCSPPLPLDR